jgi:hypothetical protein
LIVEDANEEFQSVLDIVNAKILLEMTPAFKNFLKSGDN